MIKISNITVGYQQKKIIKNLSLDFEKGEFCALLGPNGAGKSTLLNAIIGFLQLWNGNISVNGTGINKWQKKEIAKKIALIPQDFQLQFDYKVEDLILMGRFPYLRKWQNYTKKDKEIVEDVLKSLDLMKFKNKLFSQLSGGEKQRVSIARALVQDTDIILMDEAFSHLDINHQLEIMQLLSEINAKHEKLIILVSHNINLASEYCNRVVMLKDGNLVAKGSPERVITPQTIAKVYGTNLQIIKNPISGKPNLIYPGKNEI
ncbi:MAG: ABC transporter ATP-binding protein [Candidatus Cloacimonetes bacterium]|jgi:iron complex transport system ATP-binding protein|nr:ABC transporter ATP-binding protein [Candidatus Cloacimonadota bacterium]MBT6994921.1 ABC transporter ATP-binding protein [Candidatus Cloacimonadota bacterium]MBT7469065.1 ABC transporter ATP-binding protein [Candidatus Cloacimonadota bacterium]